MGEKIFLVFEAILHGITSSFELSEEEMSSCLNRCARHCWSNYVHKPHNLSLKYDFQANFQHCFAENVTLNPFISRLASRTPSAINVQPMQTCRAVSLLQTEQIFFFNALSLGTLKFRPYSLKKINGQPWLKISTCLSNEWILLWFSRAVLQTRSPSYCIRHS